jgi:hypothetical protein
LGRKKAELLKEFVSFGNSAIFLAKTHCIPSRLIAGLALSKSMVLLCTSGSVEKKNSALCYLN